MSMAVASMCIYPIMMNMSSRGGGVLEVLRFLILQWCVDPPDACDVCHHPPPQPRGAEVVLRGAAGRGDQ